MRVELPDVLSLLAHELRSPLSVLQGYIRVLQRQRPPDDPEMAMLRAMLDASGRLATLGRQASDMATWLRRQDVPGMVTGIPRQVLQDQLARQALPGVTVSAQPDEPRVSIATSDAAALASACMAVAQFAMRETGQTTALMTLTASAPGTVELQIAVGATSAAEAAALPADTPVPFDRGGLGLALAMASYVLDASGARVSATRSFHRIDIVLRAVQERRA